MQRRCLVSGFAAWFRSFFFGFESCAPAVPTGPLPSTFTAYANTDGARVFDAAGANLVREFRSYDCRLARFVQMRVAVLTGWTLLDRLCSTDISVCMTSPAKMRISAWSGSTRQGRKARNCSTLAATVACLLCAWHRRDVARLQWGCDRDETRRAPLSASRLKS